MSNPSADPSRLSSLVAGQPVVYGGDRVAVVDEALAASFVVGDRIVVDPNSGTILHIPAEVSAIADRAVTGAVAAFSALARCSDEQITGFFREFAARLADDDTFGPIADANAADVERARARGRSTTRLELTAAMRSDMIAGLLGWADSSTSREVTERRVEHEGWAVEARRAPLGVVAFVFEGRPNVFADAAGVVRTGNTVVFRIGSDALGTASAIVEHALDPALECAGLPGGTVGLVESPAHAAGWALFSDPRLSLAVARGSGPAVAQLGAVARQAGVPVSLHGTGGAWLVADSDADAARFEFTVRNSLDRKVCNTLNVCCLVADRAADLVPAFLAAVAAAGEARGSGARIHATPAAMRWVPDEARSRQVVVDRADGRHDEPFVTAIDPEHLGHEWEWEGSPEVSLHVVESVDEAVRSFNRLSPRFVASLESTSAAAHDAFYATVDAPFVGDGFTRWVDGQYALDAPELGLSNWEGGRMLGRGGILSGDSVYTVRYRATVTDPSTRR
jgi:glutamate-5-semialdehyde dehydrogenase